MGILTCVVYVESSSALDTWLHSMESAEFKIDTTPIDKREQLTPAEHCWYVSPLDLRFHVPDFSEASLVDLDACMACKAGSVLFAKYADILDHKCQIASSSVGESIVHGMLFLNINKQMRWPPVFGNMESWTDFWKGSPPPNPQHCETCSLAPLMVIRTDQTKAVIAADVRWLLLISALCGPSPSQASTALFVSAWVQHFFRHCVPDHMIAGTTIFTGLVAPLMKSGFLNPERIASGRQFLRRPEGNEQMGICADTPTGVIEDYCTSEPLYMLARQLKIHVNSIVDDSSCSYSFPTDSWTPVTLTSSDGSKATCSLKFTPQRRFILAMPSLDNNTGYIEQVRLMLLMRLLIQN